MSRSKKHPNQKPDTKVMLAYAHPGHVKHVFMESVLQTFINGKRQYAMTLSHARSGPLISRARNKLTEAFLESDCTHLLFADTDMHFEDDRVQMLLDADKDIVAGLCFGQVHETHKTFVAALTWKDQDGKPLPEGADVEGSPLTPVPYESLPESGLVPVNAVGMAFTLIKREVMETLGADNTQLWPFAESIVHGTAKGEDVTFCLRAAEKGFTTWLCVDARIGHEKEWLL